MGQTHTSTEKACIQNDSSVMTIQRVLKFLQVFIPQTLAKRILSMVLISVGVADSRITELTGLCNRSVRSLKKAIRDENIEGLFSINKGSGKKSKTANIEQQIVDEIEKGNYFTRQQIADMIMEKFQIKLSVWSVGRLLKKTGLKN